MIDWNDIRVFLAVARAGTTLAASRELKVSQSTAARRIAALEQALGLELFDKRPAGYAMTDAAGALLQTAEQLEVAAGAFEASAAALARNLTGTVRLTTNSVFANTLLANGVAEFRQAYPQIRLELIAGDRWLDLAAGEADVALRAGRAPTEAGLVGRRLAYDRWSLYCARTYADAHGVPQTAEDLARHAVLTVDEAFPKTELVRWVDANVPASAIVLRQNNIGGLLTALRSGLGVSAMSDFIARDEPDLVYCFTPPIENQPEVWLITHERLRRTPRVRAVMDFLAGFYAGRSLRHPA